MKNNENLADHLDKQFPLGKFTNPANLCSEVENYLIELLREFTIIYLFNVLESDGKRTKYHIFK